MPATGASGRWVVPVVIACILVLSSSAIYFFSIQKHGFEYQTLCEGNLETLGRALAMYHAEFGRLPPAHVDDAAGKPMLSWRVLILPYLDEDDASELYKQYRLDQPWDSPHNGRYRKDYMPFAFHCPSVKRSKWAFEHTHFLAVTGAGTAWSDGELDGPRRVLLVEAVGEKIPWTEPADINLDVIGANGKDNVVDGVGSPHSAGPLVLWSDGMVERWSEPATIDKLRRAAARE